MAFLKLGAKFEYICFVERKLWIVKRIRRFHTSALFVSHRLALSK